MKITFKAPKLLVDTLQDVYPVPATKCVPKWFKDLRHTPQMKTVKGCMPFFDSLTAGYIIKLTYDLEIQHGVLREDGKKTSWTRQGNPNRPNPSITIKHRAEVPPLDMNAHNPNQLKGSPMLKKNGHETAAVLKFMSPWRIITPPGYSTLFISPMNNPDDRFEIVPAIVDTDEWEDEINFPFIINGDKYKILQDIVKVGTPIVQCIPFKRDNWESEMKVLDPYENEKTIFKMILHSYRYYRDKFWKRKKCT